MRSTQNSTQTFPALRSSGAFALCALPVLVGLAHEVRAQNAALPVPPAIAAENAPVAKGGPARFDIEFQDIPVADLLVMIAKQGGVEISITGDVAGSLRFVNYKNVTAEEAVERVVNDAGLFMGRRGEQFVVAATADGIKGLRSQPRAGQSRNVVPDNQFGGFPGLNGINPQHPSGAGGNPALYVPELERTKKDKNKSTSLIRLRNVPPRMMAYWLDPANNAPDIQTTASRESYDRFRNNETIRPIAPEVFAGVRPSAPASYPTAFNMIPTPGMFRPNGFPSQFPQNGAPQLNDPRWGSQAPQQGEWQTQTRDGIGQPFVQARPRIGQLPGRTGQPFTKGNSQFGGGFGGGGFGNNNNNNGGGGFGGGGNNQQGQQNLGVFDLPDGIDAMVAVDAQNALLIRGTAQGVEELQQIVDLLDQPLKQVEIEAMFVTLTRGETNSLGINFSSSKGPFSTSMTTGETTGNFVLGYTSRDFRANLGASLSQNRAKIVTAPRIVAINNLTASIQSQVQTTVLLNNTVIGQGAGQGGNVVATNQIPVQVSTVIGIAVTPTINGDGTITVLMQPQVQQQGRPTDANPFPTITSQSVQTVAFVRDGDTIALGGLRNRAFDDTKNRIPVLSGIPFLGKLFQGRAKTDTDEDLIIFLTAKIVRRFTDADDVPGT